VLFFFFSFFFFFFFFLFFFFSGFLVFGFFFFFFLFFFFAKDASESSISYFPLLRLRLFNPFFLPDLGQIVSSRF